ncbi:MULTISPECIES: hypothetical protein [unclassified Butyrivibrio]|uniref:hypothetical protein n=1 Tax=unclassified Butyrivibrio TaxID=2639466 RepID=UPI0012DDB676|nr:MULTISPECIES: hypothetical protein [unclassified Butyrivibrio]
MTGKMINSPELSLYQAKADYFVPRAPVLSIAQHHCFFYCEPPVRNSAPLGRLFAFTAVSAHVCLSCFYPGCCISKSVYYRLRIDSFTQLFDPVFFRILRTKDGG